MKKIPAKMNQENRKNRKGRFIIGYAIGFFLFMIVIPFIIWHFPLIDNIFFNTSIIQPVSIRLSIVFFLFCIGFIFIVWSNIDLLRKGKGGPTNLFSVQISPRSRKLVVTEPYKLCRNPMVLGTNLLYFALSFYLNSLLPLLFCFLFLCLVIIYLKYVEEKRLERDFGENFIQ